VQVKELARMLLVLRLMYIFFRKMFLRQFNNKMKRGEISTPRSSRQHLHPRPEYNMRIQ
jgi:hypothetical protein